MPAQLRRAGFSPASITQQKHRCASALSAHAEAPAGGEIEDLGLASDISHHRGNRPATQGFFSRPKQFSDIGWSDQHQRLGIQTKQLQSAAIGQSHFLGICQHLQIQYGLAGAAEQCAGLLQCEPQNGAAIAPFIGKDLMGHTCPRQRKSVHHCFRLRCIS